MKLDSGGFVVLMEDVGKVFGENKRGCGVFVWMSESREVLLW
jgi:hypothetical protein